MVAITGSKTVIGLNLSDTFDTMSPLASGDKLVVNSFSHSENAEEIFISGIGSGLVMKNASYRGADAPGGTLDGPMKYDYPGLAGLAQFFGAEAITTEATYYTHSLTVNEVQNTEWANIAFQADSLNVHEYRNVAFTGANFTLTPNNFATLALDFLATQKIVDQGDTEHAATDLVALTEPTTTPIIVRPSDSFLINAQGGAALSSGDKVDVQELTVEFTRGQELVGEIKGSEGNGAPRPSDDPPVQCRINVTLKNKPNDTWYTAFKAETAYKASILIGDAATSRLALYFPYLRIVQDPNYDLSEAGENQHTFVLEGIAASSAPSGMLSVYPHAVIRNQNSSKYRIL